MRNACLFHCSGKFWSQALSISPKPCVGHQMELLLFPPIMSSCKHEMRLRVNTEKFQVAPPYFSFAIAIREVVNT
jgi:hypothetical protein